MLRVAMIAGCVAALVGCASKPLPAPGWASPTWYELTSEHFTMWTDARPEHAHVLLEQMEFLRQVIVGVAFRSASSAGRISVIALRDHEELSLVSHTGEARTFTTLAPLWRPTIVLAAYSGSMEREDRILAHELTHALSFFVIRDQPRWLAEGMATYFENLRYGVARTIVYVGLSPRVQGGPQRIDRLIPVSTLLGWNERSPSDMESDLYATASALFTFLLNTHRDELLQYFQLLDVADGPPDEPAMDRALRVWKRAFPTLPFDTVDGELKQWLVKGQHTVLRFNVKTREWPITQRTLGDADVHALRGLLFANARRSTESRDSIHAALAIEPTHLVARLVGRTRHKLPLSRAEGRAIAAAHRDDWRAWWLAAVAILDADGKTPEQIAAETRMCELIARQPTAAPANLLLRCSEHGQPRVVPATTPPTGAGDSRVK